MKGEDFGICVMLGVFGCFFVMLVLVVLVGYIGDFVFCIMYNIVIEIECFFSFVM